MRQVLDASLQLAAEHTPSRHRGPHGIAQMPWAAQLQSALAEAGIAADLQQRQPLQPEAVQEAALQHYLQHLQTAVQRRGASRLQHYFDCVRPECLEVAGYGMAPYLVEVRERHRRLGLAELRSGVHWGAEERERLLGLAQHPRDQRYCMHCAAAGLGGRAEDADHIVFECALYAHLRPIWFPDIFPAGRPHYRLRPAATLRSLTGLPLCWDARRTAQWRARPAERHADGRLRSQPSQARAAAPGGEQRDCPPPNPTRGSPLHPNPFPFRLPFPPFQAAPVHDGGLRRRALRAKGGTMACNCTVLHLFVFCERTTGPGAAVTGEEGRR